MINTNQSLAVEVSAAGELMIKLPDCFPYEDLMLRDALEAAVNLIRSVATLAGLVPESGVRLTHGVNHQGLHPRRTGTG